MSRADVEVYGKQYSVACAPGQEARLGQLGSRLDKRVRQIAKAVGDVGEARLLLIAALALIDENDAVRMIPEKERVEKDAMAALSDAAVKIDALASRLEAAHRRD
ncbi:MAG: cell division protein ZapA [Pseudomonadota bacterium]